MILRLDNDMVCPQIELFLSDVDAFPNEETKARSVFKSFFDDITTPSEKPVVRVCVDEYLRTMSTVDGGCSTNDALRIPVLLFCVYSLSLKL